MNEKNKNGKKKYHNNTTWWITIPFDTCVFIPILLFSVVF